MECDSFIILEAQPVYVKVSRIIYSMTEMVRISINSDRCNRRTSQFDTVEFYIQRLHYDYLEGCLRCVMDIQSVFSWLKPAKQTPLSPSFYESIYPESVRYALRYRKAQMGKDELRSLIHKWHFETVYLVTKALAYDRDAQRQFLEDLTRLYYNPHWTKADLENLLRHYIASLPDDISITGTKLAQLSRSGSDEWQHHWHNLATKLYQEEPHALPCIVANTPIFGYHHFVATYQQRSHTKLFFLIPDWLMNPDETLMGYEITLKSTPTVRLQVKNECLFGTHVCEGVECPLQQHFCKEAVFIDDTINTATTAGKLQSFWLSKYGLQIPLSRVRVIVNLQENKQ